MKIQHTLNAFCQLHSELLLVRNLHRGVGILVGEHALSHPPRVAVSSEWKVGWPQTRGSHFYKVLRPTTECDVRPVRDQLVLLDTVHQTRCTVHQKCRTVSTKVPGRTPTCWRTCSWPSVWWSPNRTGSSCRGRQLCEKWCTELGESGRWSGMSDSPRECEPLAGG